MKVAIVIGAAALLVTGPALADHYVRGYVKRDGTYVAPHYQSDPNGTRLDNYSTRGNVNPYTGQPGTKDPYRSSTSPLYTPQPYSIYGSKRDTSSDASDPQ